MLNSKHTKTHTHTYIYTHTHTGGLLVAPIAADYLHMASPSPQTFAVVNEAASVCNGSCAFTFDQDLTPTLSSVAETSRSGRLTRVTLTGSSLLPPQNNKAPVSDIRVYVHSNMQHVDRSNRRNAFLDSNAVTSPYISSPNGDATSANVWMSESCAVTEADYFGITCTLPPIPAGVHNVQVLVPGRGASTENVTLSYGLILSSVSPSTVRLYFFLCCCKKCALKVALQIMYTVWL